MCVDSADNDIVENDGISQFGGDLFNGGPFDGVEPLLPVHDEGAARPRADQQEFLVCKCAQLNVVLSAQGFAPAALELFCECSISDRFGRFLG